VLSEYPHLRVAELVGRAYRSLDSLPDMLGSILSAAIHETSAHDAVILAPGICEVRSGVSGPERTLCAETSGDLAIHSRMGGVLVSRAAFSRNGHSPAALLPLGQADSTPCDGALCNRRCVPIVYQNKSMGCVAFTFDEEAGANVSRSAFLQSFAREVAFLVKRHDVSLYARRKLGIDAILIGSSRALRRMEEAIEKVAQVDLPVVIEAEFGSQELAVAAAIHCCSARSQGPFVVTCCASQQPSTFRAELASAFGRAHCGTLFLQSIDELDPSMQKELLSFLRRPSSSDSQRAADVRLLASTSRPFDDLVKEGRLSRFLRTEVAVLKVEVPPLRRCREDIRPLLEHELRKHQHHSQKKFSSEALAMCEAYDWPENFVELQRAVARLAIMTESECIEITDLQQHLGWPGPETWENDPVPESRPADEVDDANEATETTERTETNDASDLLPAAGANDELNGNTPPPEKRIVDLALRLIAGNYDNLDKYGVGMKRALTYVAQHFDHDISLTQLAKQSFFSPSHLSFLFKKTLGLSFKGMLAVVRIEKAKRLLLEKPCDSVTEISLDVGFGDLSHFEKTFKRSTGLNPREFRRRKMAEMAAEAN
jgi:DNA-binding NtrC family response regulator/AraC-like DNA-binding protein